MNKELAELKQALARIEADFSVRTEQLRSAISRLETSTSPDKPSPVVSQSTQLPETESFKPIVSDNIAATSVTTATNTATREKIEPSFFLALLQTFLASIAPLLNLVSGFFDKAFLTYQHYQKQGKAPVFLMTLAGVAALLFGFGYLLQYSFNHYFSALAKVVFGFCLAIGIANLGIIIIRKKPDMSEYGTAIITLGIVLGYLCAYFAGPYYQLVSATVAFILLTLITLAAYTIAHFYETRVVTVLSLLGGALTPVIMGQSANLTVVYFAFLLVLSLATLILSQRIRWPVLASLTFMVSVGMIEWTLLNSMIRDVNLGIVFIIHGFFYLFFGYLFWQFKAQLQLQKQEMIIAAANIIFLLYTLDQVIPVDVVLGGFYLANGIVFLLISCLPQILLKTAKHMGDLSKFRAVGFLVSGALLGFAVLALLSPELMGIFWGVEGLMLLYLGFTFSNSLVRKEACCLILISAVDMLYQAVFWVAGGIVAPPEIFVLEPSYEWVNLLAVTLLIYLCVMIFKQNKSQCTDNENRLTLYFNDTLTLLYTAAFIFSLAIFWADAIWVAAVIPMFYSLYRSQRYRLPMSEFFGFSLYGLLFVPIIVSAVGVGNFHFGEQSLMAKIARVEVFLCLWLVAEFYRRYCTNARLARVAIVCRHVFFLLIPLFFLSKLYRSAPEYFPLGLWLSLLICLTLYNYLRYTSLRLELKAITVGAVVVSVYACALAKFDGWNGHALPALLLGNIIFGGIVFYWRGLTRKLVAEPHFLEVRKGLALPMTLGFYFFALSLFIVFYGLTESVLYGLALVAAYLSWIFTKSPPFVPLRQSLMLCYGLLGLVTTLLVFVYLAGVVLTNHMTFYMHLAVVVGLISAGITVYLRLPQSIRIWQKLINHRFHLWYFHFLIFLAYNALFLYWFHDWGTPALSITMVIHGSLVLLQTLHIRFHRLLPLAITLYGASAAKIMFFDMVDSTMLQKIIAFMGIGVVLLGAAYVYQYLRKERPLPT